MCKASLVPSKAICSERPWFCYATQLTIMHCNIIETRPRAARGGGATLDLTKQKLLRQPVMRHDEHMT